MSLSEIMSELNGRGGREEDCRRTLRKAFEGLSWTELEETARLHSRKGDSLSQACAAICRLQSEVSVPEFGRLLILCGLGALSQQS